MNNSRAAALIVAVRGANEKLIQVSQQHKHVLAIDVMMRTAGSE